MQYTMAKLVNEQRVIELLECYGADTDNWPEEERAAASSLIKSSAALQQHRREVRRLDAAMDIHSVKESLKARPDPAIVANIINALPEQDAGNTVNLSERRQKQAAKRSNFQWIYGVAAAATVVFLATGIILQQQTPPSAQSGAGVSLAASQGELDQWMWQEATGPADDISAELDPADADAPVTFMAMVELDVLPNDE